MELLGIALFLFGASLGSFLNVAALRFLSGESFLMARSHCPRCLKTLRWYELIPILSFFVWRGRCRTCREPIAIRYLLVEVGMGLFTLLLAFAILRGALQTPFSIFLASSGLAGIVSLFIIYLFVGAVCFFIVLVDYDSKTIPVFATRLLMTVGFFLIAGESILTQSAGVWWTAVVAFSTGAFFLFLWAVTRGRGMGLGDAELSAALALFLTPLQGLGLILFSFWSGAIWSIGLLALSGYGLQSRIPFGPFIALGFFAALFWGGSALSYLFPFQ